MKKENSVCCLLMFLLLFCNGGNSTAQTSQALKDFIKKENLNHAGIGFKAVDLTTGKVFANYNDKTAFTPASILKIVTTATALDVLGSNYHYETPLFTDGIVENAVLKGNLYIKGSGDPTLGSEFSGKNKEAFVNDFLSGIKKEGIRTIEGDVVALDQLFGYEGISHKYLWEDLGNYYAPGVYGISVFDNTYRVFLQSFSSGSSTRILSMDPEISAIHFTNDIIAGDAHSEEPAIFGLPFSYERRLYGTIPADKASFELKGDIPDPGLFLAEYLVASLRKNGIEVKGKASTYRLAPQEPPVKKEIAVNRSNTLASIVKIVNFRSNNHYAEHLFKTLTLDKRINLPAYWKAKGLDATALFMYDGSGISPSNAVSAGFLTDILVYMDKKTGKTGAFYQSLPVAGKEGTVASLLKKTVLEEKVHIKSGSITNVQSYAGYVEKGDKRYAFTLIINNFTGKRAVLRKDIEQLLIGIF
jgi:D-alanyl-D-alanine carboxypeptidase/D-alanyl-D-alanine-endopeptidase (penicillin-binding protein 4)